MTAAAAVAGHLFGVFGRRHDKVAIGFEVGDVASADLGAAQGQGGLFTGAGGADGDVAAGVEGGCNGAVAVGGGGAVVLGGAQGRREVYAAQDLGVAADGIYGVSGGQGGGDSR
ncbi:hypothetical protein AF72_13585 [Xylella taiwanensis]|uniref:Uncharacterized protein n=1 Tax=Xylella taiwanensis TaxID=1444770 RepID=Z9JFF9_9GAMM|nr:hypothetical protein AF72_13585 [Xylella taiwanensis]